MADPRPFLSGFCNRSNPPAIHAACAGTYQRLACSCSCHRAALLRALLVRRGVDGLVDEVEQLLEVPGEWPPAARRLVAAARELLIEEVSGRG